MNARSPLLAPDRRLGRDPGQVRVNRDRRGLVVPPQEITRDAVPPSAHDLPGRG